ncbi:integral membrane [Pyrenophora seminiperda CCB06]|uniref:GDP-mannose transporter n=1 Tax=Pyrenophora seminiperda CCB06 TaxID=1302712 RepID=A0A3M7LZT2_9PLEO|nr:integral membrane [Pyrenophora seminiperda CCB06]
MNTNIGETYIRRDDEKNLGCEAELGGQSVAIISICGTKTHAWGICEVCGYSGQVRYLVDGGSGGGWCTQEAGPTFPLAHLRQDQGPAASYLPVPVLNIHSHPNVSNAVALSPPWPSHAAAMMNTSRAFTRTTQNTFRKPLDFLSNLSRNTAAVQLPTQDRKKRRNNSASSLDDTDHSDVELYAQMETSTRRGGGGHSAQNSQSQSELQPAAVPLIDIGSRSNSPYPRNRSAAQSEDEDDDYETASSIRPLVDRDVGRGSQAFRGFWQQGGPGAFFFSTWQGWQLWVGLLSYLQLIITHILLILVSSLLRFSSNPLHFIGFGAAVPPSHPAAPQGGAFRGSRKPGISAFARWLSNGSGGIAGGGLFEFDWQVAKQVLPLAIVFVVKVLLSNFSFAYAPLPTYQVARIGITPLAIILSCILQKENITGSTLSSALVATLNLFFASYRSNVRVTWESVVAGVFSSFFVALYPLFLLRTYRSLLAGLVPSRDVLTGGYPSSSAADACTGNREETRAFYRTLHYTSIVSLMLLTPLVILSGEVPHILHNIPFLDVPFFWAMMLFGGMGSWAVFSGMLLLVRATSPLSATFVAVPRSAFQLVAITLFRAPAQTWVGVVLCWVSSAWFLVARRDEGRGRERLRLEGR